MDFGILVLAFIGGMLFDHFLLNKVAGLVSPEVAKLQADAAAAAARVETILSHLIPGAAPAAPTIPLAPPTPPAAADQHPGG
jgi:hypothetical protein